jgi:hypothetical protein
VAQYQLVSHWFRRESYLDMNSRPRPFFELTRKGFTLLAVGFAGAKAQGVKALTNETPPAVADGVSASSLLVFERCSGGFPRPPGRTAEAVKGRANGDRVEDLAERFKAHARCRQSPWFLIRSLGSGRFATCQNLARCPTKKPLRP